MPISLDHLINDTLERRRGTLTISNMGASPIIDFHPGLDVCEMFSCAGKKKNAKRGKPAQHPDFALTVEFLVQQNARHPGKLKKTLYRELEVQLDRAIPDAVFNAAYKATWKRKRGRPRLIK